MKLSKTTKKRGGRGEINEKILEKSKLEKKLEKSKIDEKALQERRDKKNTIKNKIQEKEQERENLNQMLKLKIEEETNIIKQEQMNKLKENEEKSKQILEEYIDFFKNEIPKDEEIDTLIEKCLLIEKYRIEIKDYEISEEKKTEIENLKKLFQNSNLTEEIINNKISNYNKLSETKNKIKIIEEKISTLDREQQTLNKKAKKWKKINIITFLSFVIFIAIGIFSYLKDIFEITLPTLIIGGVSFITFLVSVSKYGKTEKNSIEKINELNDLKDDKKGWEKDVNTLEKSTLDFIDEYTEDPLELDILIQLTEIKTKFSKYQHIKNSMNALFEKQSETVRQFNELDESLKDYLGRYFEKIDKAYPIYAQELKLKKNEYLRQKQDYEAKVKAREEYERENNIKDLKNKLNNISKEEIEDKIKIISEEINSLNDEKNYNKNQIELLESNIETVFDIENELEEIEQKISEMNENCDILEKTKMFLEKAKDDFSSHYLTKMQDSFIKNIEIINGNKMDINLDVNLNVKINEQGENKKIDFFSTGYKDLIYICMRLSLIDSLFEKETPFIILDDPFVNLDENKTKNAMNLLKEISKKYQIIYFICHDCRDFI